MTHDGQCEAETSDDRAKLYTRHAECLEKAKLLRTLNLEGS